MPHIISPSIRIADKNVNVRIDESASKCVIVEHNDDNKYVICSKDGRVSDIEIDDTTLDLLISARHSRKCLAEIIDFFTDNNAYNQDILTNKNVLSAILSVYEKIALNMPNNKKPDIDIIVRNNLSTIEANCYKI